MDGIERDRFGSHGSSESLPFFELHTHRGIAAMARSWPCHSSLDGAFLAPLPGAILRRLGGSIT
jgi:hypothetical protein